MTTRAAKSKSRARTIDFEIAKARRAWFRTAKERGWDDDIRDYGWKRLRLSILASRMRQTKVKKHDEERTLLAHARTSQ